MKFVSKKEKGFTIIELIISIFILSVALVGIFSAFFIVTILTSDASDRLTGTYLAQEGMEIVRNIRDTNWLNMDAGVPDNATWADGLDCSQGCEADYKSASTSSWSGKYLNMKNGFYVYDTNNSLPTKFKRKITTICFPSGNCSADYIMKVAVQVSWDEKANILYPEYSAENCGTNCITSEETLYDWYNYAPPQQ